MSHVILACASDGTAKRNIIDKAQRFRHSMVRAHIGWDVQNGTGNDYYDSQNPVYVIARNDSGTIEGCWRALPTTGPYMLRDAFPQLMHGQQAPCSPTIWELSCFAVSPASRNNPAGTFMGITSSMLRSIYDFALRNGIERYITVTSVGLERMIRRVGFSMHRFGPPARIGNTLSVANWTDINDDARRVVDACKFGSSDSMHNEK